MGLFLLVRMGLVHMWAFYLKSNGLNKIRKQCLAHDFKGGRQGLVLSLKHCFILLFN